MEALDGNTGRPLGEVVSGVRGSQREAREEGGEEEFTLVRVDAVRRLRDGSAVAVLSVRDTVGLSVCTFTLQRRNWRWI